MNLPACETAVLVFETSFFTDLPDREQTYGLPPDLAETLGLQRYGFHGLYHSRACQDLRRQIDSGNAGKPLRMLSICLDPKPEVCAVIGQKPVTVTGGATPLEGIPGETSSGEIDPSIALTLAREKEWGPEQINRILSRHSGLKGMADRSLTVMEALTSESEHNQLAREVLEYRIQMACGAGISAMGGVDGIAFSGRYVDAAESLGASLKRRLLPALHDSESLPSHSCTEPRSRIVADLSVLA
jgi:acetate kinase